MYSEYRSVVFSLSHLITHYDDLCDNRRRQFCVQIIAPTLHRPIHCIIPKPFNHSFNAVTSDWLQEAFSIVLVRSRDHWNSTVSFVRHLSTEDNCRRSHNITDWLKLNISAVGYQLSDLEVKRSRARPKVLGSSSAGA